MGSHYIIIAGEEAGPASNKMGGIWNVIHEEAHTLAALFDSGKLKAKEDTEAQQKAKTPFSIADLKSPVDLNPLTSITSPVTTTVDSLTSNVFSPKFTKVAEEGLRKTTGGRILHSRLKKFIA